MGDTCNKLLEPEDVSVAATVGMCTHVYYIYYINIHVLVYVHVYVYMYIIMLLLLVQSY